MRTGFFTLILGLCPALAHGAELPSAIVTHPDLEISLFAMEPDVVDPVALCFDADGRMYVVEMRDYPYGIPPANKPGGTVRLLEDTDGDGRADRSVLFAENLSYPTSVAPYRNGVIVTAPPEIIFLADTDNDGKADVREVLFKGFRRGVTDGNMSGLRWGLDNWLHGVNGGPGGLVVSTRNPDVELRLGNLDFRLRPDAGEIETTFSTGGGFGLVFDEWGRSFTPHNINHMQMRIVESKHLQRNRGLPPIKGTESISDHGEMARIYSISKAQTRPNHPEQAGYFSSSGGVGFIGHADYPADLAGSVTVCDVVGNLVHRDVLSDDGPVLKASRSPVEQTSEFIASTDPAFRPTGLELGPDGALYLTDMHRAVIEHPDYIPKSMLEKMDIREGDDQGRIYRVIPKKGVKQSQAKLSLMTPEKLVDELRSPNQWRRMTAQRLLVEGNELSQTNALARMAIDDASPTARVHALWTLAGLNSLDLKTLLKSFTDEDLRVVENGLLLGRHYIDSHEKRDNADRLITALSNNANAGTDSPRVHAIRAMLFGSSDRAMVEFLVREGKHRWARIMAMSVLTGPPDEFLYRILGNADFLRETNSGQLEIVKALAYAVGSQLPETASETFTRIANWFNQTIDSQALRLSFIDGLNEGVSQRGGSAIDTGSYRLPMRTLAEETPLETLHILWQLETKLGLPESDSRRVAIEKARTDVATSELNPAERIQAVRLLGLANINTQTQILLPLFGGLESLEIQQTALDVLRHLTDLSIASGLLDQWRTIHPSLKRRVTLLLLSKRSYHDPLLTAIESGQIRVGELNLDLEDRRRLLRWSAADIQERAKNFLSDGEYGNRQAKVEGWMKKLPANGNAAAGKAVFETACAQCHKVGELGFEVGPNLTGVSHRSVEDLVSNILDPNMAINPNYLSVSIESKDGELYTGILTAETADAVTLLQAQAFKTTLNRSEIEHMESTGISLMPEGLETAMTPKQLRDLVAFLQE